MAYTSRHDLPWWSDPDYDECGNRHEATEQVEDEPDEFCIHCSESVTHPMYRQLYAEDVTRTPAGPMHNVCIEDHACAERQEAIL